MPAFSGVPDLNTINATLLNLVQAVNNLNQTVKTVFPLSALTGSAVFNPPSLASGATTSTTVTIAGAIAGSYALPAFSLPLMGIMLSASIDAPNTATVVFTNPTAGPIDLASGTLSVLSIA